MSAIVVIESGLDLSKKVRYRGKNSRKKELTREELLNLLLIKSDNAAAYALAESMGGLPWFVYLMNKKADDLGMINTRFQDPSGLGAGNKSSAQDLVTLLDYAYFHDIIRNASSKSILFLEGSGSKKKPLAVNNTNHKLLEEFSNIVLSKTGTTTAAGKCLVMLVLNEFNQRVAIVILGGKTREQVNVLARTIINNL